MFSHLIASLCCPCHSSTSAICTRAFTKPNPAATLQWSFGSLAAGRSSSQLKSKLQLPIDANDKDNIACIVAIMVGFGHM
jgi:hypothetical protein